MKKIHTIWVFLAFVTVVNGQHFSLRLESGAGQYSMKELKALQTDLKNAISALDVESVERFPTTLYYGIQANYHFNKRIAMGVHVYYNTTAGRNHVADYSGEYKMDMLLSSVANGTNFSYTFAGLGKMNISAVLGTGVRLSGFRVKEDLMVYGDTLSHSNELYRGVNYYVAPAIEVSYPLVKKLELIVKAGYELNFRSVYVDNEEGENKIIFYRDNLPLNIDYSGFRLGVGIAYNF
jgi:hypothetical protein